MNLCNVFPARRVPVLLQLSDVECGAACLAMVLSYHGRRSSVSECSEHCGIGRDGVTARTIAAAARHYGLRVKVFSVEPSDIRHITLPAIAHWNFNHFVVVERWSPRWVDIADPASGRRRLRTEDFDAGFTGVMLMLEPGAGFERRHAGGRLSWRSYLLASIARTPGLLVQILAASLVLQLIGLALPITTQIVVDRVLPFRLTEMAPILGVGIILAALMQVVTGYLRAALLIYLQGRLDAQLMLGFVEHLLSLPFRYFQQRSSGDLLMRLGSNATIRDVLTSQTVSLVLDGLFVLGYLVIIMARDAVFGALVLGLGVLQALLLLGTRRRVHRLTQSSLAAQAASQSYLVEALNGIAALKASGAEERALDHWSDLFYAELNASLRQSHVSAIVETAMTGLRVLAPLALLWVGALRVLDGTMSLGTMLALNALAAAFLAPLASLAQNAQRLQLVGAHVDRIADVVQTPPEQEPGAVRVAPRLSGRIDVRDVGFRYDPQAPPALQHVSLAVEPGQKIALVGRTGSGKSTLALLLMGLYTPTEGEIRYDGIALPELNYRSVRGQFGVVLQETRLFAGSIRDNIAVDDPALPFEQVVRAARLAGIHDDIAALPMGYETRLAEGGVGLSGGQRQRLAIARALARKPAILVLDEATSHLDVVTEHLVDQNLSGVNCTRIVIAHRLSTIRNADTILVLDGGVIVEQGTHEDLVAGGGHYAALVCDQESRATEAPSLPAA